MTESLDNRLLLATEKIRRKRKLEAMLREAQTMLRDARARKARLFSRLEEEQADVAAIEGMTLTAMFFWLIGRKDEKLDKERQELVAAKLKHDDARKAVAANQRSCDEYERLLADVGPIDSEFERLLEKKRRVIYGRDDSDAAGLSKLELELSVKDGLVRELKEAIVAGESALEALQMVRGSLYSARDWGNWDMFSGGWWTTMIKHSHLDDARRRAMIAQERLRRFRTELADAGERLQVSMEIGGFTTFADYFFDGLFVDWAVQNQIHHASDTCVHAMDQVQAAIRECRRRMKEAASETSKMLERRQDWILRA